MNDLVINKTYSFIPIDVILGSNIKNAKLLEIIRTSDLSIFTNSKAINSDVTALHKSVRKNHPDLPNDPRDLTWLKFESDNNTFIIAKEYIQENTLTTIKEVMLELRIYNVDDSDSSRVAKLLTEYGYNSFVIEKKELT